VLGLSMGESEWASLFVYIYIYIYIYIYPHIPPSATHTEFLAFLKKRQSSLMDAIVEKLDGVTEPIVTQFLLHEAAHNAK